MGLGNAEQSPPAQMSSWPGTCPVGVTRILTWDCRCGCEARVYYGWGDGRDTPLGEKPPIVWLAPAKVHLEAESVAQVESYTAEFGIKVPMRGAALRGDVEGAAQQILGGGHSRQSSLVSALLAMFRTQVEA